MPTAPAVEPAELSAAPPAACGASGPPPWEESHLPNTALRPHRGREGVRGATIRHNGATNKGGLQRQRGVDTSAPLMRTRSQGRRREVTPQTCSIRLAPQASILSVCLKVRSDICEPPAAANVEHLVWALTAFPL